MWKTLAQSPEDAWQDALDMPGSQVAEQPARRSVERGPLPLSPSVAANSPPPRSPGKDATAQTIHPTHSWHCALDGRLRPRLRLQLLHPHRRPLGAPTTWIEHLHRHARPDRERPQSSKLDQALRHLPSGDEHANRVDEPTLPPFNLTTFCCDLCSTGASVGPDARPRRRHAQGATQLALLHPAAGSSPPPVG